jgi:hypothetical protein
MGKSKRCQSSAIPVLKVSYYRLPRYWGQWKKFHGQTSPTSLLSCYPSPKSVLPVLPSSVSSLFTTVLAVMKFRCRGGLRETAALREKWVASEVVNTTAHEASFCYLLIVPFWHCLLSKQVKSLMNCSFNVTACKKSQHSRWILVPSIGLKVRNLDSSIAACAKLHAVSNKANIVLPKSIRPRTLLSMN